MAVAQREEENPLVEGLERLPVPATTLVIFGATGDLARRKLLPAIYNLAHEGALPERFNLIGVSRRDLSDDDFRDFARESIEEFSRREAGPAGARRPARAAQLHRLLVRRPGRLRASSARRSTRSTPRRGQPLNRAFYLSTAPEFFAVITSALKEAGSTTASADDVRVIIEKPFGTDLESARELQEVVHSVFREQQVFRIDHYLGKETVQNVMAFRFANYMFEPVWNRNYIDHIQITAAEDLGHRLARRLLRPRGRAARPRPEPHAAAADAGLHGAAGVLRGRQGARREGQGAARRSRRRRPRRWREMTVRAQYTAGVVGGRAGAGLPRGGRRPGRLAAPRPTPRCAWRSTTGAGRACRSCCAPASGWRAR